MDNIFDKGGNVVNEKVVFHDGIRGFHVIPRITDTFAGSGGRWYI